ncbi:MAG: hypothetical protein KGI50_00250 [Patescibacteria group bacterium]|nr:hypothetical protein [Patescibacteria group bacterium]MDE2438209.1 hypothetical protein [Patescibacteria group bacterium]
MMKFIKFFAQHWIVTAVCVSLGIITITFHNPFAKQNGQQETFVSKFSVPDRAPDFVAHWITQDTDDSFCNDDVTVVLWHISLHNVSADDAVADIRTHSPWVVKEIYMNQDDSCHSHGNVLLMPYRDCNGKDAEVLLIKVVSYSSSKNWPQAWNQFSRLAKGKKVIFTLDSVDDNIYRILPLQLP